MKLATSSALVWLVGALPAQEDAADQPVLVVEGQRFDSWAEYRDSPLFQERGLYCGTAPRVDGYGPDSGATGDCSNTNTTIRAAYAPGSGPVYRIPVVFHVIENTSGQGFIPLWRIDSQIEVLNRDFRALPGSYGGGGIDAGIEFYLATEDPAGNPTLGIERVVDDLWFEDDGSYWDALAWDTSRYLNVYTNNGGGYLGYATAPSTGVPGLPVDRVVLLHSVVGDGAPFGAPYDMGRSATHEVGHYLGLYHTFNGGCWAGGCYSIGDLICDTNPVESATYGCPQLRSTCGAPAPVANYMDYTDDACKTGFTAEQVNRMRCTIVNWRPDLHRPPHPIQPRWRRAPAARVWLR